MSAIASEVNEDRLSSRMHVLHVTTSEPLDYVSIYSKSIQTPSLEILTLSSTFTVLGRPTRVCGGQGVSKISDVKL